MSACTVSAGLLSSVGAVTCRSVQEEIKMAWKAPKIIEVPVGMEINMYACAARK